MIKLDWTLFLQFVNFVILMAVLNSLLFKPLRAALQAVDRAVGLVANVIGEAFALLLARVALAGIFWRSYKTKVEEGTWLQINDTQYFLFEDQFSGLPIPTDLAVPMATYAEFLFPILLVLGLATRFSAVALLIMTLVIQIFADSDR